MAILKNKGFTLIEVAVSLLVFIIGIGVFASSYINLVKQNIINQRYQAVIGNLKLGLEKIWREMKYGVEFQATNDKITFKRSYDCKEVSIYKDNNSLIYELEKVASPLTDPTILTIENLKIKTATATLLSGAETKVMLATLALSGKAKIGFQEIPINFQISVAPINSIFPRSPCQ